MNKFDSPYSAALTGGGFLFDETDALLPMLMSPNADALLADEKLHNNCLHINAETSRKKAIIEIRRRFNAVPVSFWHEYLNMSKEDKVVALFYVLLKTYKVLFDFHTSVTMRKWNSAVRCVDNSDLMMALYEIAARDKFVDSWSESTKKKITGAYLTMLRKVGMIDVDGALRPLSGSNFAYYLQIAEPWFLEACLLEPYQVESIKKSAL